MALQADVSVFGEHSPCSGQAARSFGGLSPGVRCLFPPWRAVRAARGVAPSPRVRRAFSFRGPTGLRKSLDRNRGLFAVWERVSSLGLSLPLSPPPCLLPPAGMGQLFSGVSQSLCFANRRGVFRPVNLSSLSHSLKKLPPTALRAFWLVLTSNGFNM